MKTKQLIRENFRNKVFKRDGFKCKVCNNKNNLDAHHIVDRNEIPNGGYVVQNGITLCGDCHLKAEQHHINPNLEEDEFSPDSLYRLIGSNFTDAYVASMRLK